MTPCKADSSDRSLIEDSELVIISMRLVMRATLRSGCEKFNEVGQHAVAILPGQGDGKLCDQHSILNADVVTFPLNLKGEVFFRRSQLIQGC